MQKLLLIEDMAGDAHVVSQLYNMATSRFHSPVEVRVAATWQEGVDLVREFSPDVVVLDLGLPDSSTDMTVKHIGEVVHEWPPIFVLTGNDVREKELRIECIGKNGATDLMLKKVAIRDPELLTERIWHCHLRRLYGTA